MNAICEAKAMQSHRPQCPTDSSVSLQYPPIYTCSFIASTCLFHNRKLNQTRCIHQGRRMRNGIDVLNPFVSTTKGKKQHPHQVHWTGPRDNLRISAGAGKTNWRQPDSCCASPMLPDSNLAQCCCRIPVWARLPLRFHNQERRLDPAHERTFSFKSVWRTGRHCVFAAGPGNHWHQSTIFDSTAI